MLHDLIVIVPQKTITADAEADKRSEALTWFEDATA